MVKKLSPQKSTGFKWETYAYILVFVFAFILRLIYLLQINNVPAAQLLVGDAVTYDAWAGRIAGGEWIGKGVFYQAPLYPYFLGVLYFLLGGKALFAVRLVQIVLGSGSCVLLSRAGRSFFKSGAGILSGVLLALHPTAISFDCSIQKSVLDLFFICALLAVLGRLAERSQRRWWVATGLVLGLLALTRENALIFLPILLAWLFISWRDELWQTRLYWAGLVLVGLAAVLLPIGFRNLLAGGEFHLTTSQLGPNFYIGNRSGATGTYEPLQEGRGSALFEREDATKLAEAARGRTLTPSEVSNYWTARAFDDIRADIFRWARLLFRKWLLVWNATEMGDSDDQYTYGDWSPLLQALNSLLHFGTLCPLAALGICLTWNRRRQLWILYAMILVYAGSVVLFYVFARYRFPLVPMLILFAAAGLTSLRGAFREARWRPLWSGAAGAVVVAAICNHAMISEALVRADSHNNFGNAFVLKGQIRDAIDQYEQALALNPGDPYVPFNLAAALLEADRPEESIGYFNQALRIDPKDTRAHYKLGIALLKTGQPGNAIEHFEQVVQIDPTDADARVLLGSVLYDQGKGQEAMRQWEQALQVKPAFAEAHYNMANAFLREGRFNEAITHYDEALRIKPEYAEAHCNVAIALERVGRLQDAIEHYEQALLLRPDLEEVKQRLAVLRRSTKK